MTDVVDRAKRSLMMSGIRGKNTRPEIIVRSGLHRLGFRFRLHTSSLPGKPDLVFPKFRAIILVNGCFWHGHDCHLFKWPATRSGFWRGKISRNMARDRENLEIYDRYKWRVLVIWECALKGKNKRNSEEVVSTAASWLQSSEPFGEIRGNDCDGSRGRALKRA